MGLAPKTGWCCCWGWCWCTGALVHHHSWMLCLLWEPNDAMVEEMNCCNWLLHSNCRRKVPPWEPPAALSLQECQNPEANFFLDCYKVTPNCIDSYGASGSATVEGIRLAGVGVPGWSHSAAATGWTRRYAGGEIWCVTWSDFIPADSPCVQTAGQGAQWGRQHHHGCEGGGVTLGTS